MKKIKLFLLALVFGVSVNAQISIDEAPTAQTLVENVLIGNGVTVSNVTFTGNTAQIGRFDNGNGIGLPFGVTMSSGLVTDLDPTVNITPSTTVGTGGDADVLATAQSVTSNPSASNISTTNDAAVLEFDFTPMGDTVRFNFVFGSEEYETYINTVYNDAFGFYLTGTNPATGMDYGGANLAVVPGTAEPITISTIHPGLNAGYYINNASNNDISFNGYTVPIQIIFPVICGNDYHFKFAVADCQDGILDTGVFLEGGSFSSDAVQVAVATVSGDTNVYEGCSAADFIFTRPSWQTTDTLIINYDIEGGAIEGTDYGTMTNPVTFLPGEDTVILQLTPTQDGLTEGAEDVIITAYTISACGDTVVSSGTVWILDEPNITMNPTDSILLCANDSVLVSSIASGGFAPYTYSWSNGVTDSAGYCAGIVDGPTVYDITVTDVCGFTTDTILTITLNQTLQIDTMFQIPSDACSPTGSVSGMYSGQTGALGDMYFFLHNQDTSIFVNGTAMQNIPSGWYYLTVTDLVCTTSDSVFVDPLNPPIAQFSIDPPSGCGPLDVVLSNSSTNTNEYYWDFGNGNTLNVANENDIFQTYTSSATVMLVAYSSPTCADTAYMSVNVEPCGCTDPLATNYNPMATIDNGSCLYPTPTVITPNVVTPNGDGTNDIFYLKTTNAATVKMVIVNRWGSIMYEETIIPADYPAGAEIGWDGTTKGKDAAQGTYIFRYYITSPGGEEITGHGFLELIRE